MRSDSKPVTQRQLRVGEQIRHILSECFQKGDLPDRFFGCPPVTVLEVKVSSDFSYCKAYLSVVSVEPDIIGPMVKELNEEKGYFRKVLGRNLRLRVTPDLKFFADGTQSEADRIDALLASEAVQRDVMKQPE